MTLYEQLKADLLQARKQRVQTITLLLSTVLGEIELQAKNGKNLSDPDIVGTLKKFIKNLDEVITVVDPASHGWALAKVEKMLLESYLPQQLSQDALNEVIDTLIAAGNANMGAVMKALKQGYAGTYDGSMASALLKTKFA
jgi:uncharacterized protein YqeY